MYFTDYRTIHNNLSAILNLVLAGLVLFYAVSLLDCAAFEANWLEDFLEDNFLK